MVAARRIEKSSLANDTIVAITAIPANMFTYSEMTAKQRRLAATSAMFRKRKSNGTASMKRERTSDHYRDGEQEARDHERE